jgi:hypothetical protein
MLSDEAAPDGCVLGQDGDATLPFQCVAVHHTLSHVLVGAEHLALLEHGVNLRSSTAAMCLRKTDTLTTNGVVLVVSKPNCLPMLWWATRKAGSIDTHTNSCYWGETLDAAAAAHHGGLAVIDVGNDGDVADVAAHIAAAAAVSASSCGGCRQPNTMQQQHGVESAPFSHISFEGMARLHATLAAVQ